MKYNVLKFFGSMILVAVIRAKFHIELNIFEYLIMCIGIILMSFEIKKEETKLTITEDDVK